jgi:hypothetical protein
VALIFNALFTVYPSIGNFLENPIIMFLLQMCKTRHPQKANVTDVTLKKEENPTD